MSDAKLGFLLEALNGKLCFANHQHTSGSQRQHCGGSGKNSEAGPSLKHDFLAIIGGNRTPLLTPEPKQQTNLDRRRRIATLSLGVCCECAVGSIARTTSGDAGFLVRERPPPPRQLDSIDNPRKAVTGAQCEHR